MPTFQLLLTLESPVEPSVAGIARLEEALRKITANPSVHLEPVNGLDHIDERRLAAAERAFEMHKLPEGMSWDSLGMWQKTDDADMLRRAAMILDQPDRHVLVDFDVSFSTGSEQVADAGCFTRSAQEIGQNPYASRPHSEIRRA
jgi:hypothetical protein